MSGGGRWVVCVALLLQLTVRSEGNWLKNFAKPKPQLRLMEGVTEHLHNVMPYEQVQFSSPNVSTAYISTTKFQAAGMGHLYFITNKFIQYILSDQAFPEGFIDVEGDNTIQIDYLSHEWPILVSHYWASATVLVAGLVFAVLMPLIGLTLCCCRCTGGCGSRSQPFDAKYDSCKRQFYGMILAGLTILISFGVVCTFVSNEYLEDGVKELPTNVKKSLNDTRLFINNTKKEVDNLLVVNFDELEETLSNILEASGEIVKKKLGEVSKASVLSNLTAVVNGLGLIKQDLSNVDSLTRQLQETALQLDAALKECRSIIMKKLESCRFERTCRDILNRFNIQDLSLEANFSQLPNVTATLKNISDFITADIEEEVMKGQQQFEKVKTIIQNAVNDNIPEIKLNIRKVGNAIKENSVKVDKVLDRVDTTIANSYSPTEQGEGLLKEFSPYRYYVCLGVAITLFLILICLTLGLFCGFCGSRPEGGYHHDDCCNKGTGASYLMMAVWLMFLSSAFLMIIALFYFVTGVTTDRIICEPLQNPTPSRVLNIVNRLYDVSAIHKLDNHQQPYVRPSPSNTDFNISSIIRDCHHNMSLFQVLKMERLIDLNKVLEYPTSFGIDQHIDELVSKIKLEGEIVILTPEAEKQLIKLSKSPLSSINFPAYTHVLGEKITSIDLIQLADALNQTASQLPMSKSEVKFSLTNQAMYLKVHQAQQVALMLDISQRLESTANQLQEHLRFNHSSLRHAVEHLLIEVEQAQKYLYTEGPTIVTKLAKEFGEEFNKHIDQYLQRVVSQIREDVGKCWPMSQAYNATIVAGCQKILNPYNGFWMSVGICSILFMPIIILCVKLASLYQKSDPYPGPLVEAEYLYDAYTDRENIPLASSNNKKKNARNKPRKKVTTAPSGNRSSNIPIGYENMSNPEIAVNTSANESRHPGHGGSVDYSAHLGRANIVVPTTSPSGGLPEAQPKPTWDFPNGGPPHYQNPISSEYERPPPYYYPGPSGPPGAPPESQSS
ncbi:prominin-like protein isoform X2 [Acyrthosiphon pisum]|uniref:Prominin-like protein n=1 Tax=Acyrthosiphon pisum TaxID=7029 RepID=A0A8R2A1H3_ACYPI|nr:prominin-like protein isoform X2 [Acyrthosiphon pisum]|eukprot:XP_001946597.2 PREDICTED: prominin-like protein isoform X2 [Acyrthosiphon pisum]